MGIVARDHTSCGFRHQLLSLCSFHVALKITGKPGDHYDTGKGIERWE
jgi:hypothetical protein